MTGARLKILILGGYGTFGGRLARLLANDARLTLVIAGRSPVRALEFCASVESEAELQALAFDRNGDVMAQLAAAKPDIVVDASGPFQGYGRDRYRVVRAAIALGIHYLDLADASDFVKGIAQLDADARATGVVVLSGVSSVPVLTAAAVRHLSRGLAKIESIVGGIAPSPFADVGVSVVAALASYAGKPVRLIRDGQASTGYALIETRRFTISPPGRLGLKNRLFSLVDVPDLTLLPEQWPGLKAIWFGAAPVPEILHRLFGLCAWLVRLKIVPTLAPLAELMHRAKAILRWGEDRGGMYVAIAGRRDDGAPVARSWHMVAEGDDGPYIPSMPAAIIVRRFLENRAPAPGARAALNELELADYAPEFAKRRIVAGCREITPESLRLPLYRQLLGEAYASLPQPVQALHDLTGSMTAKGRATVERGSGLLAQLAARIIGFPEAGTDVPITVRLDVKDGQEIWTRNFAGKIFSSTQEAGRGRAAHLLCERFGPCVFGMALVVDGDKMRLIVRRWTLFGLPLPVAWAPFGEAYEHAADGRFGFHVEINHPLTGPIVRYRGWLVPEAAASDNARQEPRNPALVGAE